MKQDEIESAPSGTRSDSPEGDGKGKTPPGAPPGSKAPWRPFVAAALSLVFAGLGHLYLRQWGRGALYLIAAAFLYTLSDYSPRAFMLNIILFIFSAVDAFSFGKRGYGIV